MKKTWETVVKIASATAGAIAGAFGEWDTLLTVLAVFIAVDYLSGLIVAAMGKSKKTDGGGLSSKVGWSGLGRKGLMILVVILAAMLDKTTGDAHVFRTAACWFYVANEGLSILENMAMAGVPFPEKIKDMLEQAKEKPPAAGG